jgi:putative N-acetylmannosamine-6-phosphate epimerase
MQAMAKAAVTAGAVGIRANGPEDIRAIRKITNLPIIGIYKIKNPQFKVYITPTLESAMEIKNAGTDIIALDATFNKRENNLTSGEMIKLVKEKTGLPVMADISSFEEGIAAAKAGADIIATTFAKPMKPAAVNEVNGYRPLIEDLPPSMELISQLCSSISKPVIAEGRFWNISEVLEAFERGAYSVVVGSAITRPSEITFRFVKAINDWKKAKTLEEP